MIEVELVTQMVWPDKNGQPWYTRHFWARFDGRLSCVGMEIRSARLREEPRNSGIADFATPEETKNGRAIGTLPADAGSVQVLKVGRRMVYDIPPADFNGEAARDLRIGELLREVKRVERDFEEAFNANAQMRAAKVAEWRNAIGPRHSPGRRPLDPDVIQWAADTYEAAVTRGKSGPDAVSDGAMERWPDKFPGGPAASTVGRWLKTARDAGLLAKPKRRTRK